MKASLQLLMLLAMVAMSDPCQAQTIFGKEYPVGYNNIGWVRGVGLPSGGLMVSARPSDGTVNSLASSILTTDEVGDVVSLFRYEHGLSDQIMCMERSSNGDIIVGSASGHHFGDPGSFDMMIKRLDPDGNVIWAKALGSATGSMFLFDMVEPVPGVLIGVASVQDSSGAGYPLLFRLTGMGDIVWSHRLTSTAVAMQCVAITTDPAGGVVVSGRYSAGSNHTKMLAVHLDLDGNVDWSHTYGATGYSEASAVLLDPNGGFVIVGSLAGGSPGGSPLPLGGVIRTNASGIPYSMFRWGLKVEAGHCFADRSLLLFTQVPGGNTGFIRIDTTDTIQWSALLEASSYGEIVPLYGSSRFAYVSCKISSDVTITTLTDELNACDGDSLPYTTVVSTWENHAPVVISAVPLVLLTLDIPITMVPLNTSMVVQCEEYVGVPEQEKPVIPKLKCDQVGAERMLSITGLDPSASSIFLSDMLGRRWPIQPSGITLDRSATVQLELPHDLAPGIYVASVGSQACTFLLSAR